MIKNLPAVATPQYLICSDLDATYLAHDESAAQREDRLALERLLHYLAEVHQVMFCIVTGSSLQNMMQKVDAYNLQVMPHFLATGLGSDIVTFDVQRQTFVIDAAWYDQLSMKTIDQACIDTIWRALHEQHDIGVSLQPAYQQGERSRSYWLQASRGDIAVIARELRERAQQAGLYVNASHGSVHASEDAGVMNVDFVPAECGKQATVAYLQHRYDIAHHHTFAFGDSGNDLSMLRYVAHGLLVANATDEAKRQFTYISEDTFSRALLNTLRSYFDVAQ